MGFNGEGITLHDLADTYFMPLKMTVTSGAQRPSLTGSSRAVRPRWSSSAPTTRATGSSQGWTKGIRLSTSTSTKGRT